MSRLRCEFVNFGIGRMSLDPMVKPILDLIDRLFEIEREARDFEELARLREEKSAVKLEELQLLLRAELLRSRSHFRTTRPSARSAMQ